MNKHINSDLTKLSDIKLAFVTVLWLFLFHSKLFRLKMTFIIIDLIAIWESENNQDFQINFYKKKCNFAITNNKDQVLS